MKVLQRVLAVFLCTLILFLSAVSAAGEFAPETPESAGLNPLSDDVTEPPGETENPDEPEEPEEPENSEPELSLSDQQATLSVGSKMKITAEIKNAQSQNVVWSSDNTGVATVDNRGVVTAKAAGRAKITALLVKGEQSVSSSCTVTVTARRTFFHYLLMIGYRFSNMGDYYYSDNDYAWQKPFGFIRLYDTASQIIGYQYDFTRMVFTYGNKDWLIEFWKGQYAPFQFGAEIGVYTKYAVGFGDTPASAYNCPVKSDWLDMEMTLYHKLSNGTIRREFTRDYGKYWWCDGYRIGRLNKTKPATELQMVSRITLKDEKMAAAFGESLLSAGFKQVDSRELLKDDTFCLEGSDVYFIWRNLTTSQHLIPVLLDTGFDPLSTILAGFAAIAGTFLGAFGNFFGND